MRHLLLFTALAFCFQAVGQDTTNSRLITSNINPAGVYFTEFDTDLTLFTSITNNNYWGFINFEINPADHKLYTLFRENQSDTSSLYRLNPLTGDTTFVYDLQAAFAALTAADDGTLYGIHGNAESTQGAVFSIDPFNQSMSSLYQSGVSSNESRAMAYDPESGKLYIISSTAGEVFIYDIGSGQETVANTNINGAVKAAHFRNDSIIFGSPSPMFGVIDLNLGYDTLLHRAPQTNISGYRINGITEIKLVDAADSITACAGDTLEALYTSNSYQWYRDGNEMSGATSKEVVLSQSGTYRLVTQIGDSARYIWSEPIQVNLDQPDVSITPMNAGLCEGDTVMLTGASGGTLQWYRNGTAISGATSQMYAATETGSYNQVKTNASGCSDSADMAAVVSPLTGDTCIPAGIAEDSRTSFSLYPNPTRNAVHVKANQAVDEVTFFDLSGTKVLFYNKPQSEESIDINVDDLPNGMYIVKAKLADDVIHRRLVKR